MFLSFLFSWFVIEVLTSQNFGRGVTGVAFHPTKNLVASCSYDSTIKLWNTDTGAELSTLSCDSPVYSIDWHDNRITAGCEDGTIKAFDAQSGDCLSTVRGHSASVNCVDFSPDGLTIASGSGSRFENDNSVRVWDVKTGKQLWQLRGHRYAPSPSRECFLSCC